MTERRQVLAYVLGTALVLALIALALWRAKEVAQPSAQGAELRVWQVEGHPDRYQTAFEAMSTDATLTVEAPNADAARAMFLAARRRIDDVNRLMSTYLPDSEVSRLNRQGSAAVSDETVAVFKKANEVSLLSGGAFDVTYAPLRTLWRRAAQDGKLPADEEVQKARAAIGYDKLKVTGNEVRFTVPGMEVDLGGIAKGYAIDLAAQALQTAGARAGIVDIGHDVCLFGRPEGEQSWRVEIYPPPGVTQQTVIDVPSGGVATSGDYARGFRVGDQWFSHIIDPRTGRPVEHMSSVTIVAADAVTADGLATAVSVMGWPKGMELVEKLPGVECLMMVRQPDGTMQVHQSSGFGRFMEKH